MPASSPDLDHVLREFLDEWRDDRREGRTMKVLHDRVGGLEEKFDEFKDVTQQRVTALETNAKRDAEQRVQLGPNGTGRFQVPPESVTPQAVTVLRSPNPKPPQSWWGRSPFKEAVGYGTAALVAGALGVLTGRQIAVPVPSAVEELPHMSTRPAPPPPETYVDIPSPQATASVAADAGQDARRR